ncbi:acryloyl-CoA reductase [Paenibacillus pinihumi]|uniref:acrylyl-CoA reductase family protein n=1 Tax=Paenibacillus pinihumi TaxID=669462 RepID=UPI0003FE17B9|nr:acryloyl-CoA reductase [Paenibacillus pinihumi]
MTFSAFVVDYKEGQFTSGIRQLEEQQLPESEVTIRVAYSSINYKDGLASVPEGKIVKSYPFIPGIDLAGTVISSADPRYKEGDEVIVTGYGLGVSHFGGLSQIARVPADWIVPLPQGLSLKEAMLLGTAGFTAALSLQQLERNGLKPGHGPVLVTGATGGVGSLAAAMLTQSGYEVAASTGKAAEHDYLRLLGVSEILSREEVSPSELQALGKQRWTGAIDSVGGHTLAHVISTTRYGGSVAACGLTGGTDVPLTVFPFILRGVNLLGIDSVQCPMKERIEIWRRLGTDLKPIKGLTELSREVTLEEVPDVLAAILRGEIRGRTVVNLQE